MPAKALSRSSLPANRPMSKRVIPLAIVPPLAAWFAKHARPLPWRIFNPTTRNRDGYHSLVSEIMLQQTQVSRVIPAFNAFIALFPTVTDLANAQEDAVLAAWKGLGYYRRARMLHAASKAIVALHAHNPCVSPSDQSGPQDQSATHIPRDAAVLRELPGVGRYTAGAVASLAFGQCEPIVDANVARVLVRLAGISLTHGSPETLDWAWKNAEPLAKSAHTQGLVRQFNEGLMELGATLCTPGVPKCDACPIAKWCEAKVLGIQESIPLPKPSTKKKAAKHFVVIIRDHKGRVLIEQRGAKSTWPGLWQFTTLEFLEGDSGNLNSAKPTKFVRTLVADALGIPTRSVPTIVRTISTFERVLSHRVVRFIVLEVTKPLDSISARDMQKNLPPHAACRAWVDPKSLDQRPLTTPQRLIAIAAGLLPRT